MISGNRSKFTSFALFHLKNGMFSIVVSLVIIQSLIYMLEIEVDYAAKLPLFLFVLIIITVFFAIIFLQERNIRSQQEQLLAVIKNSAQGLFVLDKDRRIISLNDAGKNLLGLRNNEIENFCEVCSNYPGADKICDVSKCFLTSDEDNPVELYIKNTNNVLIPVQATTSYYTTPEKERGIVVGLQPISEKRKEEHKQIQKLITHSILQAQEKERKLISRELHDGVGQSLFGMLLQVDVIKSIPKNKKELEIYLDKLQLMIKQTIEDVRNLSAELRPSTLDDHGLISTLKIFIRELGNRFGMQINLTSKRGNERLPSAIETALYRIAQEALLNAAKYSSAERIDIVIDINIKAEIVSLSITDFGKGFEMNPTNRKGVGIYSMEERASMLGGVFSIVSEVGKGTKVQVQIPIT
ncbi:histidine kinase [Schinkia azotoformans MEV2011]|uniref:Oxygen sensor histidine kinase NreB n=1 Tax=Schinkia azotoformans MEV2011 TaxID=1348973 RepID=A0A072NK76_SCHAZ|nr:histidine kinase [Schinkia azotoformans]KEF37637.1 histidine kinase [Schinkia azotoformans MEV2011]MEC1694658.1 histidine kinase [Schinkia azotoformans]MEC1715597.1 histidine kinase [Schinkia azotoformans]MEC1726586.1 histidine kinase [Schinkia azotoformans]MEC1741118.1 histidine kinase [Schinkia azotoformans]